MALSATPDFIFRNTDTASISLLYGERINKYISYAFDIMAACSPEWNSGEFNAIKINIASSVLNASTGKHAWKHARQSIYRLFEVRDEWGLTFQ